MKIKILGMAIVAAAISFASSASDEKMMVLAGQEIFLKNVVHAILPIAVKTHSVLV